MIDAHHANSEGQPEATPRPLSPNQDQRDREEVWANDLHPGLVRVGRREKELLRGMFVLKIEQRDAETPLCSEMIYFRRKLQDHARRL